jgi:hypothetical protein
MTKRGLRVVKAGDDDGTGRTSWRAALSDLGVAVAVALVLEGVLWFGPVDPLFRDEAGPFLGWLIVVLAVFLFGARRAERVGEARKASRAWRDRFATFAFWLMVAVVVVIVLGVAVVSRRIVAGP